MTNETEPSVDEIMTSIRNMMAEGEAMATDEDIAAEKALAESLLKQNGVSEAPVEEVVDQETMEENIETAKNDEPDFIENVPEQNDFAISDASDVKSVSNETVVDLTEDMIVERPDEQIVKSAENVNHSDLLIKEDIVDDNRFVTDENTFPEEKEVMSENNTQSVFSSDNMAEELLSAPAVEAAAASLSNLTKLFASQEQAPVGRGNVTLEALTKELLKPYLKEWLDKNLPIIVERVVKKEIARIIDKSQG